MGWFKTFAEARRAALAEYGIESGPQRRQWFEPPDDPLPEPEWSGPRESGDDPAPLPHDPLEGGDAGAAQRIAELEAQIAGLQGELNAAREVHENDDRLLAELGVTGRFVQNCTLSRISALPCRVVGPSAGRQRHLSAKRWHRALPSRPGRIRAHTPLPHPHRQP